MTIKGQLDELDATSPDWLQHIDLKSSSLSYHLLHPELSADAYIQAEHIKLGASVLRKKRIYLDQKYWIQCRRAACASPEKVVYKKLYELLKRGVKSEQLVCPVSHLVLQETLKQNDPGTLNWTARVIQELSEGIAIQPFPVLLQLELKHFFVTTGEKKVAAYLVEQRVWTYVANVFGCLLPVSEMFDPATLQAVQKAWFDLMASIEFPVLAEALAHMPDDLLHTAEEFYKRQNTLCKLHRGDFTAFKQVFLIELAGFLDACKKELYETGEYLKNTRQPVRNIAKQDMENGAQLLSNLIYHAFEHNKIKKQLAGLRIISGIHAAIRHRGQKYKRGDQHDHFHARVALPYSDLFLTEKNLCHLLTTKPLEYDKLYGCRVVWKPEEAVAAVEELLD